VGGATYAINFEGNKSITLGAEYFYNSASYSRDEYLGLLIVGGFQPFYVGKHYLALSATLLEPPRSGLDPLRDREPERRELPGTARLRDHRASYLSVESYVAGHFGRTGGSCGSASRGPRSARRWSPGSRPTSTRCSAR
jgi:hypothetical protein